jgi:L-threonylcarbamoyladenylate synthase
VVDPSPTTDREVRAAAAVLRAGGLVAFPTETVYGLGADASSTGAVGRIFVAKGRPSNHPLIVHLGSPAQLDEWAIDLPAAARLLADAFWPGPLTLVVPKSSRVADAVTGGRPTVGLRVPDHPVALALLDAFGGGIAAPSANRFGRVSPTTADDVRRELGERVDVVLDGGPCQVGLESTIVDLTGADPEVLRPGGVTLEQLAEVLGSTPAVWDGGSEPRAPGMLWSHYAPSARVEVVGEAVLAGRAAELVADGRRVSVIVPAPVDGLPASVVVSIAGAPDAYARRLYALLRGADEVGADVVLAVAPPAAGVGVAVRDRLRRASSSFRP